MRSTGAPDGDRRPWFDRSSSTPTRAGRDRPFWDADPAAGDERPWWGPDAGVRAPDDARHQPRLAPPAGGAPEARPLVEVEHLTKIYEPSPTWMKLLLKSSITEPVTAVADLSLQVWPGQVFAVVGPNGAGKSTLFRVLTGLITPTSGRVALAGIDVIGDARTARRHIGFMPAEDRSLNLRHTCWQNLAFHGRLQGIPAGKLGPRIDEVLDIVGLGHVPDRTGHALSSGMRARLQLARALLHEPDILILDEPTGTIDPVGAHDLLQLVQRLADERQLAVLLSSHRLEEIDALEDNVLFINKGEVVHTGSMDSLRAVMEQPILRLRFDSEVSARAALDHLIAGRDHPVTLEGTEVHVGGNPSPGVVLPRLGPHLARLEAVDRSRMPLQELISRLMRGDAPRAMPPAAPAARSAATRPTAPTAPIWPGPP
ncbi:MAG TPA: ABC transporter ATP-binding protein, partial [Acidimicrobiales bacterium]|nr:ABC transporter ATP-binding protein [Acidimicrobiales bacterium]